MTFDLKSLAFIAASSGNGGTSGSRNWSTNLEAFFPCDERVQTDELRDIYAGADIPIGAGDPDVVAGARNGGRYVRGVERFEDTTVGAFAIANGNKTFSAWMQRVASAEIITVESLTNSKTSWVLKSDATNWIFEAYDTTGVLFSTVSRPHTGGYDFIVWGHDAGNDEIFISVNNGSKDTDSMDGPGFYDNTLDHIEISASGEAYIDHLGIWSEVWDADKIEDAYNAGTPVEYISAHEWAFTATTTADENDLIQDTPFEVSGGNFSSSLSGAARAITASSGVTVDTEDEEELFRHSTLKDFKMTADIQVDAVTIATGNTVEIATWGDITGAQTYTTSLKIIEDSGSNYFLLTLPGGATLQHSQAISTLTDYEVEVSWDISTGTWSFNVNSGTAVTSTIGTSTAFPGQGGLSKLRLQSNGEDPGDEATIHWKNLQVSNIL